MAIRLVLNDNARWSYDTAEYYKKHQDAFQGFDLTAYQKIISAVCADGGNASCNKRADGRNNHFYEIYDEDFLVGEICLTRVIDDTDNDDVIDKGWEINLAIYDDYQKQGYGRRAIEKLFEIPELNTLYACVNSTNPLKVRIENMLQKLGFNFDGRDSGYWIKNI